MRALLMNFFMILWIYAICDSAHAYDAPIGIPDPGFGIDITYRHYDSAQNRNSALTYHHNTEGGYHTHYVHRTEGCTDAGNLYGDKDRPRCTLPETIPAGSVVEIHGNGYTPGNTSITIEGTVDKPAFIRGFSSENKPDFDGGGLTLTGSYYIIENLELYRSKINVTGHHGTVRHSYIHGQESGGYTCDRVDLGGSYHLLFKNEISYQRKYGSDWIDCHGVQPLCGSDHIWILENDIHHNSGDAFQTGHGCDGQRPRFIYVGKNTAHEDIENAFDTKYVEDIVISQNVAWGYEDAPHSDGTAIIIGSDGAPNRAWVIFNTIHDAARGIRNEASSNSAVIGNLIYNIEGDGIKHDKDGWNFTVVHNTIVGTGGNGFEEGWRQNLELSFEGNIVANLSGGSHHLHLGSNSADFEKSTVANNLFFQNGNPVRLQWNNSDETYANTSELINFPGGPDNIIGDPKFSAPASNNFSVSKDSEGVGLTEKHPVYDEFNSLYGISITYDISGRPRPTEEQWTAGAFETGLDPIRPNPPTDLLVE